MGKHRQSANPETMRRAPMLHFADIIAEGITAGDKLAELYLERALLRCVDHPLPKALAKWPAPGSVDSILS